MKKLFLAVILVLAMAFPVFADNVHIWGDQNNTTTNQGGAGGAGGAGSASATIAKDAIKNTNEISIGNSGFLGGDTFSPKASVDNTNLNLQGQKQSVDNTNVGVNINTNIIEKGAVKNDNTNKQKQGQMQGQMQGQKQGQDQGQSQEMNNGQEIAPVQTTTIITEKPFLGAPSTVAPEVSHGSGKVIWGFKELAFAIPYYKGEVITSEVDRTANVKAKDLIRVTLKMIKDEDMPTYTTRLLIVKKEAQKSYAVSIIGSPAGSGVLGTSGVAGSGVVGPSFSATKANDLFDIYLIRVIVK